MNFDFGAHFDSPGMHQWVKGQLLRFRGLPEGVFDTGGDGAMGSCEVSTADLRGEL